MKTINCTVSGEPTDRPLLVTDGGQETYALLSEGRAVFEIPDQWPPHGATIRYGGKEVRVVIPVSGAVEGPLLVYAPKALPRLRVEGTRFVTDQEARWIWAGATHFLLFQRFLEGQDIVPLFYPDAALYRVTASMGHLSSLAGFRPLLPESYARFFEELDAFVTLLAQHRKRVELTLLCDMQRMGLNRAWQQRFVAQCGEVLQHAPNAVGELANEYAHPTNRVNPGQFTQPRGVLMSRGSGLSDRPPYRPGWDFYTIHPRRDQPKVRLSAADPAMWVQNGWQEGRGLKPVFEAKPTVNDELTKFGHGFETSEELAGILGGDSRLHACGGTFHTAHGTLSEPWDDIEARCGAAFFRALQGFASPSS